MRNLLKKLTIMGVCTAGISAVAIKHAMSKVLPKEWQVSNDWELHVTRSELEAMDKCTQDYPCARAYEKSLQCLLLQELHRYAKVRCDQLISVSVEEKDNVMFITASSANHRYTVYYHITTGTLNICELSR